MKLAIVHDYLIHYGGAERVLETIHEIWPSAPIFTILYKPKEMPEYFKKLNIKSSFVRKLPFLKNYEKYFFLFPTAIEQFDFSEFDVVLSISSAWAKGIITTTKTLHICYLLNPMRFAWEEYHSTISGIKPALLRMGVRFLMNYIRLWDILSTQRIDHIITISQTIRKRVLKYYGRDSTIIYPPCNTSFFTPDEKVKVQDFFLIVSRLRTYKRIDIAIEAFNKIGLPLIIIGDGNIRYQLEKISRPNIQFLGILPDEEILSYYRRAQAVILPGLEDFGIVPIEAQSCGTPVIAFKGGGALETIIENQTGEFFYPQTKEALIEKIKTFDRSKYNPKFLHNHATKFDKEIFKKKMKMFVEEKYNEFIQSR